MPTHTRTHYRRRSSAQDADPVAILRTAIAALTAALSRAAPKETPAIARQLVAAAKELEQALIRAEQRRRAARREAEDARREREIDEMAQMLRAEFPDEPWGDCPVRDMAETLHENGMYEDIMMTGIARGAERAAALARPASPPPAPPPFAPLPLTPAPPPPPRSPGPRFRAL